MLVSDIVLLHIRQNRRVAGTKGFTVVLGVAGGVEKFSVMKCLNISTESEFAA